MAELLVEVKTAWGTIRSGVSSRVRSYDEEGTCFSFFPSEESDWLYTLDVENKRSDCCESVTAALGSIELAKWVDIEVIAKLLNLPAHLVLRQVLADNLITTDVECSIEIIRADINTHWIAIGRRNFSQDIS